MYVCTPIVATVLFLTSSSPPFSSLRKKTLTQHSSNDQGLISLYVRGKGKKSRFVSSLFSSNKTFKNSCLTDQLHFLQGHDEEAAGKLVAKVGADPTGRVHL
jgi:hypothetical protein